MTPTCTASLPSVAADGFVWLELNYFVDNVKDQYQARRADPKCDDALNPKPQITLTVGDTLDEPAVASNQILLTGSNVPNFRTDTRFSTPESLNVPELDGQGNSKTHIIYTGSGSKCGKLAEKMEDSFGGVTTPSPGENALSIFTVRGNIQNNYGQCTNSSNQPHVLLTLSDDNPYVCLTECGGPGCGCSQRHNTNKWSGQQDCKNDSNCRLKVIPAISYCVAKDECDTDNGWYEYEGECRKCSNALKSCTSNCQANGSAYRITCDRSGKECSDYNMRVWKEKQACKNNDNCLLKSFGGGVVTCVEDEEENCDTGGTNGDGWYKFEGECRKCLNRIKNCDVCTPGRTLWRPTCIQCKGDRVGNGNYCS
jgi:hypothetical protein